LNTGKTSDRFKKVLVYDVTLLDHITINLNSILVFAMKLDMIVLAVTRDLGVEMKDVLFAVGQSKLK